MNRMTLMIVFLFLSTGFNILSYFQQERLKLAMELVDQKDKLQRDQMNDLTAMMYQKTNENIMEVAKQQGKIEGMLAMMSGQEPDSNEVSKIWHAGYYRGLDQNKEIKFDEETIKVTDKPKK